eukprot:scaffold67341_cov67-Phaeocystis_antarctica.AAC.1
MDDKGGDGVCPACNVGVTSKAGDMKTLSLADFICSDFDSTVDNHEYPTRNCSDVDEKWAASPTVQEKLAFAPCCTNNALAFQPLVLTALNQTNKTLALQSLVLTALNHDSGDSGSGETGSGGSGSALNTQQLLTLQGLGHETDPRRIRRVRLAHSARGLSRRAHGGG